MCGSSSPNPVVDNRATFGLEQCAREISDGFCKLKFLPEVICERDSPQMYHLDMRVA